MAFKAVAVVLMVCVFGANCERVNIQNCDSRAPIQIKEVDLKSNFPIKIKPGSRLAASGRYSNNYNALTSESVFKITFQIKKKLGWWYVPIPGLCSQIPGGCTQLVKCSDIPSPVPLCPGPQGTQRFDESITLPSTLPDLGAIVSFFGSGQYEAYVDVRDNATGKRIVCVKNVKGEIKF